MNSIDIREVNPFQAWEILQADSSSVLVDVRSRFEYEYVGHPETAINIPWKELPDWKLDPDFVEKVRQQLQAIPGRKVVPEAMTILMICRSGQRSMAAAVRLVESGFAKVLNIAEGFEGGLDGEGHRGTISGWRYHRLPWKQG